MIAALTALAVLCSAAPALAHTPIPGVTGFPGGLLHPVVVPAHALALFGLGLLVGRQPQRQRLILLVVFAAGLFAGLGAIVAAFVFTEGILVLLAVAALAGLLVAIGRPLPVWTVAVIAVICAGAIMFDSVPQEISIHATLIALAGTMLSATLALALIALAGAAAQRQWLGIAVRIAGSWTAASAILVLALRLAK